MPFSGLTPSAAAAGAAATSTKGWQTVEVLGSVTSQLHLPSARTTGISAPLSEMSFSSVSERRSQVPVSSTMPLFSPPKS